MSSLDDDLMTLGALTGDADRTLRDHIGPLPSLHTADKTSTVNAINEVLAIAGNPPAGNAIEINFSFGDASPSFIAIILATKLIYKAAVIITTPFNGVGAMLSLGDAVDNQSLIATSQNLPNSLATYETSPNISYPSNTTINLYITPGAGATSGAGTILIYA